MKKNLTQEYFINSLVHAINSSGGLRLVDNIDPEENIPEEDIPLPDEEGTQVNPEDILLALPKDRGNPQENNWFHVTDDENLSTVVFNDYDIVAFKHADDEDFSVEQPIYDEPE